MLQVLGVIPARGGSKRLPRKNIKELAGHPLIAYTIKAAQGARMLTDYLVSSEDNEILEIARKYGAPTPFVRPEHLSTDKVRNIDTLLHALEFMEAREKKTFDIVVLLQPTCPVRKSEHIDEAVQRLAESDLNTAVSVKGPIKKRDPIVKRIKDGVLQAYYPAENTDTIEPIYLYNASIYAMKRDYLVKHKRHVSGRQVPIVMDQFHSIDIDTEADFLVAESYIKFLKKQNNLEE